MRARITDLKGGRDTMGSLWARKCEELAEAKKDAQEARRLLRAYSEAWPAGAVLTMWGNPIDHSPLNSAKEAAEEFLRK
jgi:hypothetical protein